MSTQYEFMKRQVVEEVAALQEKLIAIPDQRNPRHF